MNASRRRQFDDYRSQAGSRISDNTSVYSMSSQVSEKSSTSNISEACVNCVNHIIAQRHKKKEKQQRKRQRQFAKKNYQILNAASNTQDQYRDTMKKQALEHNKKMIQEHKKQHEKQLINDRKYAQSIKNSVHKAEVQYQTQVEKQKQKQKKYYTNLKKQYLQEINKKDHDKFAYAHEQRKQQGLPLYNYDHTEEQIEYRKELQRQIQQRKKKQKQQRQQTQKQQQQILKQFQKQSLKYHADDYHMRKSKNPEIFEQLKQIQRNKKKKIQDQRRQNEQSRIQMARKQNQEKSKMVKQKMKEMHNYVEGLKAQMLQREKKMRESRLQDSKYVEKVYKSTEEIQKQFQHKKMCKGCHKEYPAQFIGQVPKKV